MSIFSKAETNEKININEYIALEEELIAVRKQYGVEEQETQAVSFVTRFFDRRANRVEQPVKRNVYLWLAVLTGWMGGHRFYAKQYSSAILYLLFCWTGFPLAMTIVDVMAALPKETDANGIMHV